MWISVNAISKVSDDCIRDLEFNPRLNQKLIDVLVSSQQICMGHLSILKYYKKSSRLSNLFSCETFQIHFLFF